MTPITLPVSSMNALAFKLASVVVRTKQMRKFIDFINLSPKALIKLIEHTTRENSSAVKKLRSADSQPVLRLDGDDFGCTLYCFLHALSFFSYAFADFGWMETKNCKNRAKESKPSENYLEFTSSNDSFYLLDGFGSVINHFSLDMNNMCTTDNMEKCVRTIAQRLVLSVTNEQGQLKLAKYALPAEAAATKKKGVPPAMLKRPLKVACDDATLLL